MFSEPVNTLCVNSIRCLGAALPNLAKSGHPGAPMGCAPMAHVLYSKVMNYDPSDPKFLGRDRFVLSLGHGCALLYSMMHLTTEYMSMEDLKSFRQLHSITPGHPEAHITPGVEVTTGPLGLGIAQAVGLAMGQHHYNKKYGDLFNGYTYCMVGDGCLQEGISSEASSFAGAMGLGRLICFYDSNRITIDGTTDFNFNENVAMRYEAYGWEVFTVEDGNHDLEGIYQSVLSAKSNLSKPSLIIVKTTIGYGSAKEGTNKVHGSPLGDEELLRVMKTFNLGSDPLALHTDVLSYYESVRETKLAAANAWRASYLDLSQEVREEIEIRESRQGIEEAIKNIPTFRGDKDNSTRNLSGLVLNSINKHLVGLIGGSADLTGSNMTELKGETDYCGANPTGKYVKFGVREFAMQAITNGLHAHGGFLPFCSTFLNFITFSYPALRVAALSEFGTFFIASHDSIELGEDGPTHQPVAVVPNLRATPNVYCWRPADGLEVGASYIHWLNNPKSPTVTCLSRGNVRQLEESSLEGCKKGAYVLKQFPGTGKKVVLAASGTEVQIAYDACEILSKEGLNVTLVSMPCFDLFLEQSKEYRYSIFPKDALCASVEACGINGLEGYVERDASTFMDGFGASANAKVLMDHFGFTKEKVAEKVLRELRQ